MNIDEARKIVNSCSEYVYIRIDMDLNCEVFFDGAFTIEQLEAVLVLAKHVQLEENSKGRRISDVEI